MKINNIILHNFGSYEGTTDFETRPHDNRNIVLIGGKNGAGKTTLFTAMRLCLYGYKSMGYKSINSFYTRAVVKLINNSAKITKPTTSAVTMRLDLNNSQGLDSYTIKRQWVYDESLEETFIVSKNGVKLTTSEIADFEKYIISLIPPELFDLYFFDGEKIADFFLEEGSSTRIKDAFLTLCGYDTFEIMRKNFKRINSLSSSSNPLINDYFMAKETVAFEEKQYMDLNAKLKGCIDCIADCEATIDAEEKEYYEKGGITEKEWNNKIRDILDEEKQREVYNSELKNWANTVIPFLMLRKQLVSLKRQMENENRLLKYTYFCEVLNSDPVRDMITEKISDLSDAAFKEYGYGEQPILGLSIEQNSMILAQIRRALSFEAENVRACKSAIKRSIHNTNKIRAELSESSVSRVKDYMKRRAQLFEEKSSLLATRVVLEREIVEQRDKLTKAEHYLGKVQNHLEEELKKASISDISARAIIMLDKLQSVLYRRQIRKVESLFKMEIHALMRKTHFIDDIHIDDSFNTHIYRTDEIPINKLRIALRTNTKGQLIAFWGEKALHKLCEKAKSDSYDEICDFYETTELKTVTLPIEIDKASLSNGEKQIFIMALYHSLVQLCNHELPFVIDTPFARIDTEHRHNISKHFFSNLNGQVFILSTNEEINSSHVKILKDKIAATYMLENTDNKRTVVVQNSYFEV